VEDTIDAVSHQRAVCQRLDVHIAGPALERLEQDGVNEPDDGAFSLRAEEVAVGVFKQAVDFFGRVLGGGRAFGVGRSGCFGDDPTLRIGTVDLPRDRLGVADPGRDRTPQARGGVDDRGRRGGRRDGQALMLFFRALAEQKVHPREVARYGAEELDAGRAGGDDRRFLQRGACHRITRGSSSGQPSSMPAALVSIVLRYFRSSNSACR
jgi:hypothetical protein